jgi:hypothetical protein
VLPSVHPDKYPRKKVSMPRLRIALVVLAISALFLPTGINADTQRVQPPIIYGPPDSFATRVPPPSPSYLPSDPVARRELVISSALTPRENARPKPTGTADASVPAPASGRSAPWRLATEAVIVDPTTTVANDPLGVEEPVIINLVRLGLTHTLTTFIRRVVEQPQVAFTVQNYWSYRDSIGTTSAGALPLPAGYTDSADPVLAHNGTTGGVAPERTYMAGLALNRAPAPGLGPANPTSIRVWMSVNGGSSWVSSGAEVDVIASGTARTLDKPWIAVSETGTTTGFVYVAWVRVDATSAGQNELMFRRSRNGISKPHAVCCYPPTWDAALRVTDLGRVHGPQIVIDNAGYVYVIFVDFTTRQMRIARSKFPGANFPSDGSSVFFPAQTIAGYNRIGSGNSTNTIAGAIRVVPLPAARYNAATNEILVAWTEGETDASATVDLRLARVTADATMAVTGIPLSSQIISAGVNQFTPVIETDGTGTVMLAYYDSRGLSVSSYQERVAKLSSTGLLLTPVFPDTNPTPLGSPCSADFVGEYQGLWRGSYPAGFRYDVAWTCSSSSDRTIMRAGVQ